MVQYMHHPSEVQLPCSTYKHKESKHKESKPLTWHPGLKPTFLSSFPSSPKNSSLKQGFTPYGIPFHE
jgi:hypothetical protein